MGPLTLATKIYLKFKKVVMERTASSPFSDMVLNQGGVGGDSKADARRFKVAITYPPRGGLVNTILISSHNLLTNWGIEPQARRPLPCAGLVGPAKTTLVQREKHILTFLLVFKF
jgi:hypothetical protein